MGNLNNNEVEVINKFFQNFTSSTVKILSGSLDKEIFKRFSLTVENSSSIADVKDLKDNNILYELDYAKGEISSILAVLIPEELISSITDVFMGGGGGEESYKGSLSELEINASSDLFKRIFKDVESIYKHIYNEELAFNAQAKFLLKEMPEYIESFENMEYDFVVNHTLRVNDEKDYSIKVLLHSQDLKQTVSTLRLLGSGGAKGLERESIDIEQLSDVKINITAELGRTRVPIKYALELVRGSLIELDTVNDSDIKVFANGIEVAKAQVVVLKENFGLRITKIITPEERLKSI